MNNVVFKKTHFISLLLGLMPLLYELPRLTTLICIPMIGLFVYHLWIQSLFVPNWLLQCLAVMGGVFFYIAYDTLLSPESASSLMAFVLCLKLFDIKNHRDLMIFLIMNLLQMMFYVLFSQTLLSTFLLFINYFFFVFFLLDLQKQKLGIHQDPFSLRQLLSVETLVALPLLISLFLFFPRFTTSWGGMGAATSQSVIGFSEKLQPGQMQNLAGSELIAFRVLFKNSTIPASENLYFRGAVLTQHEGWLWTSPETFQGLLETTNPAQPFDYEILLEPRFERTLFSLEPTEKISISPSHLLFYKTPTNAFQLRDPAQSKIKIQGHYRQPSNLQNSPATAKDLFTPHKPSEQLQNLLAEIKNLSADQKLSALLQIYQNKGFEYSTQTPAYATIDDFLFGEKKGFCEHFASSFAILSRLVGLPSRVIVGFQGADLNPFGSYLIVKDKHAHAWNEVYIEDKGWVHVDVTSLVAPSRIFQGTLLNSEGNASLATSGQGLLSRMTLAWDAINSRFSLMLMNYNLENQSQWIESWNLKKWGLTSVFKILLICLGVVFLLAWSLLRRKNESVDLIGKGYLFLNLKLAQLQIHRAPHEGPLELRERVLKLKSDAQEVIQLIDRYIHLRYRTNATPHEARLFYKEVKALRISK